MLPTHLALEVLGVRGCIGKNPSPASAKNKAKLESEGQPSPLELAFGVELGLNSHSKNLRHTNLVILVALGECMAVAVVVVAIRLIAEVAAVVLARVVVVADLLTSSAKSVSNMDILQMFVIFELT